MNIFVVAVSAALCLYALFSVVAIYKDFATKSWSSCSGKLVHWDMRKFDATNVDSFGSNEIICLRKLVYEYSVGQRTYTGNRISWSFPTDSSLINANSSWIVEQYYNRIFKQSPQLVVFYNPGKPSVSVLLPGLKSYHLIRLLQIVMASGFAWMFIKPLIVQANI